MKVYKGLLNSALQCVMIPASGFEGHPDPWCHAVGADGVYYYHQKSIFSEVEELSLKSRKEIEKAQGPSAEAPQAMIGFASLVNLIGAKPAKVEITF